MIETIIFIVIAGIFVPLSYIAFSSAIRSGGTPESYTTARFLAEQKVEELTSYTFDNIPVSGSDSVGGYARAWTVATLTSGDLTVSPSITDYNNYKKVVINISGSDVGNYTVYTIVTKRP